MAAQHGSASSTPPSIALSKPFCSMLHGGSHALLLPLQVALNDALFNVRTNLSSHGSPIVHRSMLEALTKDSQDCAVLRRSPRRFLCPLPCCPSPGAEPCSALAKFSVDASKVAGPSGDN